MDLCNLMDGGNTAKSCGSNSYVEATKTEKKKYVDNKFNVMCLMKKRSIVHNLQCKLWITWSVAVVYISIHSCLI